MNNRNYAHEYRQAKLRRDETITSILGDTCRICGAKNEDRGPGAMRGLLVHRKDGQPHTRINDMRIEVLRATLNQDEWARLCYLCHRGVHWVMTWFEWDWDRIVQHTSRESATGVKAQPPTIENLRPP